MAANLLELFAVAKQLKHIGYKGVGVVALAKTYHNKVLVWVYIQHLCTYTVGIDSWILGHISHPHGIIQLKIVAIVIGIVLR